MTIDDRQDPAAAAQLARQAERLDSATARLQRTSAFAKFTVSAPVLDLARRLLAQPGGIEILYARIGALDEAGLFTGTDWERPEILQPALAANTLKLADPQTVMLEALSELRLLAVANGDHLHQRISAEQAQHFLAQVLALNLYLLFETLDEAQRERPHDLSRALGNLYRFVVSRIGYGHILDRLVEEIWRMLAQRPILVDHIKAMVSQIATCLFDSRIELGPVPRGAEALVSAVFGPTAASREDPGLDAYRQRLEGMDPSTLSQEAGGFARAMHDTGLVSPYHAVFLHHVNGQHDDLLPTALGLSSTGRDGLLCYPQLVRTLIEEVIRPQTCQAVYGLALLLERGILYMPAIAPGLWGQLAMPLRAEVERTLTLAYGDDLPARVHLLAGVLSMLGQPLGVGQGNNPTCQAARALSMWAYTSPDYLLQMVTWAGRDNEVIMHFEGQRLSSLDLPPGLAQGPLTEVDPVSLVVAPHLDRIYLQMGRLCADRGEDPHRWINPELHGWWVGRGFCIAIDVATGKLGDYIAFLQQFYATYHPYYNGNRPVIHPQPAGLAITDSAGRFIGWHAIAIHRVGLDGEGVTRVYFYNPNNDSGQDWGGGVVVSTEGHGERAGEASLPVEQFASRLYLFHYDPLDAGYCDPVPAEEVSDAAELGRASWARKR